MIRDSLHVDLTDWHVAGHWGRAWRDIDTGNDVNVD